MYRDLKMQMNLRPDLEAQLGVLNANLMWFTRFLDHYPVRYDNVQETLVLAEETKKAPRGAARFEVRKTDMQFIFDDSGGEESSDDDCLIVGSDDNDDTDDVQLVIHNPLPNSPPSHSIPEPAPPSTASTSAGPPMRPGPLSRKVAVALNATTPSLSQMRTRRKIATPPTTTKPMVAKTAAAQSAPAFTLRVPPIKLKVPQAKAVAPMVKVKAQPPPPPVATPPPPPAKAAPPVKVKKVKMISRCIQTNMKPPAADPKNPRTFKNDTFTMRRRMAAIQRVEALTRWLKSYDTVKERLKEVGLLLDQVTALYAPRDEQMKAFQARETKKQLKREALREKKRHEKIIAQMKRSASPPPPLGPLGALRASRRIAREVDDEQHARLNGEGAETAPVESASSSLNVLRVKREPGAPLVVQLPVRVKREPRDASDGPPMVRVKREPQEGGRRKQIFNSTATSPPATVNVKLEGEVRRRTNSIKTERTADFGRITAVNGDVPMDGFTASSVVEQGEQEQQQQQGMEVENGADFVGTIAAVNGGVSMDGIEGGGGEMSLHVEGVQGGVELADGPLGEFNLV